MILFFHVTFARSDDTCTYSGGMEVAAGNEPFQ